MHFLSVLFILIMNFTQLCSVETQSKMSDEIFSFDDSILTMLSKESKTLVIVFAGQGLGLQMPMFEFRKTFSNSTVNLMFIRDIQQVFYQFGIKPNGNISSTLKAIMNEIRKIKTNKIIVIGNSSGGYAALLFGYLLLTKKFPVKKILAFAPRFGDQGFIEHIRPYRNVQPRYFSFKDVFNQKTYFKDGIFHIFYSQDCSIDVDYALSQLNYPWIEHHVYEQGGHALIRELRDNGTLSQILYNAIEG